jgi:hypothetical protein
MGAPVGELPPPVYVHTELAIPISENDVVNVKSRMLAVGRGVAKSITTELPPTIIVVAPTGLKTLRSASDPPVPVKVASKSLAAAPVLTKIACVVYVPAWPGVANAKVLSSVKTAVSKNDRFIIEFSEGTSIVQIVSGF